MDNDTVIVPHASSWYLAQCKPGQEHITASHVTRRDLAEVFLPRETRRHRWRGRWQETLRPVFPGYLFLAPVGSQPDWPAICTARGLSRLVAFGGAGPARLPRGLIETLRQRCNDEGILEHACMFHIGDQARLTDGPFCDLVGRIEALETGDRIRLLLDMMGREVRVTARRDTLDQVHPA